MGCAFTAVVNDVDATYWNPAGLTQLRRSEIGFTHLEWFQDIRYEYVSYADKFENFGAIGVGVGYLYLGDIPKTFETATGDYDTANSGGTFGASDMVFNLAWAGNLGLRDNKIGLGVKIINESIDQNQSFSVGLDLGDQLLLSHMAWYRKAEADSWVVRLIPSAIGVSVKNIGTPVKFFNQNDPLPMSSTFGLAYKFLNEDLTLAAELALQPVENQTTMQTGLEYWIHTSSDPLNSFDFALRAGYRTGYEASTAPGYAFGAGLHYGSLGLDYVYMPYGDLGITHRVSLKFSWGEILKDRTVRRKKVKKTLTAADQTYQDTADKMVESKKSMEGKVVVQKSPDNKKAQTAVEAKKPENQAVAKETKTLGADIQVKQPEAATKAVKLPQGAVIKGGDAKIDNDLIAKITSGKDNQGGRTATRYSRRTQDDAARAARMEAEASSEAMDNVEAAAKQEASQRGNEQLVTKTTIYFAGNNSQLNDKYLFALDKISFAFDRFPQRTILVHGYCSAEESNKKELSMKRAEAVKDYLVQIKSIPSNKISVKGFEDKDPAAPNTTESNKAHNRRVRIQIIKAGN
jgi:outer membrane protein OmpA-like peptidoglycan-associated protein